MEIRIESLLTVYKIHKGIFIFLFVREESPATICSSVLNVLNIIIINDKICIHNIIVKNIVNISVFSIKQAFYLTILKCVLKQTLYALSHQQRPETSNTICCIVTCVTLKLALTTAKLTTTSPRGCNLFAMKNFKIIPSTRRNRYSKEKQHNILWTKLHKSRDWQVKRLKVTLKILVKPRFWRNI